MFDQNVGANCAYKYCQRKDFLPFYCHKCSKTYCLEHRTYQAHECPSPDTSDVILIICPLCGLKMKITAGDDPNAVFEDHSASFCRPAAVEAVPKELCNALGCKTVLTAVNTYSCVKCGGLKYCMKHRFSEEHQCAPFKAAKVKSKLINPSLAASAHAPISSELTEMEKCPMCLKYFPVMALVLHADTAHS